MVLVVCVHTYNVASVPGLPLRARFNCAGWAIGSRPSPYVRVLIAWGGQIARKGKAWNRGYVQCMICGCPWIHCILELPNHGTTWSLLHVYTHTIYYLWLSMDTLYFRTTQPWNFIMYMYVRAYNMVLVVCVRTYNV